MIGIMDTFLKKIVPVLFVECVFFQNIESRVLGRYFKIDFKSGWDTIWL